MQTVTDMLGVALQLPLFPKRIVCLVPSISETLSVWRPHNLVGVTKFCTHLDPACKGFVRIGGTKNPKIDKIVALQPDLIIANQEENRLEDIVQLRPHCPVWTSQVTTVENAWDLLLLLAQICGVADLGAPFVSQNKANFAAVVVPKPFIPALYLIWNGPYMAAGADTFISDVMQKVGLRNLIQENRYPTLEEKQLQALAPELLLLSSEPFPFDQKHALALQELLPNTRILLVDGRPFSWYGHCMLDAPQQIVKMLDAV